MRLNGDTVSLLSFSVHHHDHGLAAVQRVAPAAAGLAARILAHPGIDGVLVLDTCNRLEIYLDAAPAPVEHVQALVRQQIQAGLREAGFDALPSAIPLRTRTMHESMQHIFRVAAGLDSMVVGEREVTGQLRRALVAARVEGTCSPLLTTVIEHALRCSRQVAYRTTLPSAGRSVVSVGLDLVLATLPHPAHVQVLLVGTGAYAGASVHALRSRGLHQIDVFSQSGRAADFAKTHDLRAVEDLDDGLGRADLVVCCSGTGGFVLDAQRLARATASPRQAQLAVLDLALCQDVDPAADELDTVRLWSLAELQKEVGALSEEQINLVDSLIAEGLSRLANQLRSRQLDPAVVALRQLVAGMVDDEIARLPAEQLTREAAEHALRRLAARMIHAPMTRARKAAEEGRHADYLSALGELYDLSVAPPMAAGGEVLDPRELERGCCPATGLDLDDLSGPHLELL